MRGDTRANCRLSYELGRCRRMEVARAMAEGFATNAEGSKRNPTAEGDNIDMASRLMELSTSDERICGTKAPPDANEAWKYLLRAADQGHVPSMLRFVIQPPLREDKFTEDLEGWRAYTANAGRLLRAAGRDWRPARFPLSVVGARGLPDTRRHHDCRDQSQLGFGVCSRCRQVRR